MACGLILGLLAVCNATLWGDIPDLLQSFEEGDGQGVGNLGGEEFWIQLSKGAQFSAAAARFGKAGLDIQALKEEGDSSSGQAWQTGLTQDVWAGFREEIRQITIAAWVRPEEIKPFVIFWRIASSTANPGFFQFTLLGQGRLYFAAAGPEGEAGEPAIRPAISSRSPAPVKQGEWTHLAMTFNNGEVRFYANGELLGEPLAFPLETIPPLSTQGVPSMIALSGLPAGSQADEFALFGSRVLTPEEVQSLYENGLEAFLKQP